MSEAPRSLEKSDLIVSAKDYFAEAVGDALENRKIRTIPLASDYLVDLLEFYVVSENLHSQEETLAEMFLKAASAKAKIKTELLKRLGDISLYISGFFGDSLNRKIVDIDYYAEIGCSAYGSLSRHTQEDALAQVYAEISDKYLEFVDVLTYISQKAAIQSNSDLLRLYDRYLVIGSDLAKEQLVEKGIYTTGDFKKIKQ